MDVRIETLPAVEVVYCRRVGPYNEMAPQAWMALWAWVRAHDLYGRVRGNFGFGLDDPRTTPPERLRYDACLVLDGEVTPDADAGIEVQTLPGGRYAIYTLKGPYGQISKVFGDLRNDWLPGSGEWLDPTRPFLEVYLNNPDDVPESEYLTDLHLPLGAAP